MIGDPDVIALLNEQLTSELTAINQYFLHAKMQQNWGLTKLAAYTRNESMDEMRHAEMITDRILFLEGLPNFQLMGRLRIGETVEEVLRADLELELEAVEQLKNAIQHCESVRDYVSRDLFAEILQNEEEHVDTLERQFEMIGRMGIQNYIHLQSEPSGE